MYDINQVIAFVILASIGTMIITFLAVLLPSRRRELNTEFALEEKYRLAELRFRLFVENVGVCNLFHPEWKNVEGGSLASLSHQMKKYVFAKDNCVTEEGRTEVLSRILSSMPGANFNYVFSVKELKQFGLQLKAMGEDHLNFISDKKENDFHEIINQLIINARTPKKTGGVKVTDN